MQKFKLVKFSREFYRITDTATKKMVMGVVALSNGQWRQMKIENGTEKMIGPKFDTPQEVFKHFKEKVEA